MKDKKKIKVICGLIFNCEKKLLITRRKKSPYMHKWEFPGGKIESGETEIDCLKREINEELSIDINIKSYFTQNEYSYPNFVVHLVSYLCLYNKGVVKLIDHDKFAWVELDCLVSYEFLQADIHILTKLNKEKINLKRQLTL